jgi:predicted Zn-dependent protease
MSESYESMIAEKSADELLAHYKNRLLSPSSPIVKRIKAIVERLAENIDGFVPGLDVHFRVYVVDAPEANAFVLPGGQIFVLTGLLQVAKDDHGLATVLAHEVRSIILKMSMNNFRLAISWPATQLKSSLATSSFLCCLG